MALVRARGLLAVDRRLSPTHLRTSDPFSRITIASADGVVMEAAESGVVQSSLNPIWNAVFSFEVHHTEVHDDGSGPRMDIVIEDWDRTSNNDFLGRATLPLSSFRTKLRQRRWLRLDDEGADDALITSIRKSPYRGEIEIAARWVHNPSLAHTNCPNSRPQFAPNELRIILVRARGLQVDEYSQDSKTGRYPFVELKVGADSWKSSPIRHNLHPLWHESSALSAHACDGARALLEIAFGDGARNNSLSSYAELKLQSLLARSPAIDALPLRLWLPLRKDVDAGASIAVSQVELVLNWVHNPARSFYDALDDEKTTGPPNVLHIAVIQARGLRSLNKSSLSNRGISDPYVLIKRNQQRIACSTVLLQTRAPVWRETFVMSTSLLQEKTTSTGTGIRDMQLAVEVLHHDVRKINCELLGCCSVNVIAELFHRRPCRSWRDLCVPSARSERQTCGEIELEFRWVHDKDAEPFKPEPLFRLHVRSLSAMIFRSLSDSVLEGIARLGVRARLVRRVALISNESTLDHVTNIQLRILRGANLCPVDALGDGSSSPSAIVKHNGREIYRTPARYATQNPVWTEDRGVQIQVFRPRKSVSTPRMVSVEMWSSDEHHDKNNFLGEAVLTYDELLDSQIQGQEREYELTTSSSARYSGKIILLFSPLERGKISVESDVFPNTSFEGLGRLLSPTDDVTSLAPESELPAFVVSIEGLAISQFSESSPEAQALYICASLHGESAVSSVLLLAGNDGVWPSDILRLSISKARSNSALAREELRLEVKTKKPTRQDLPLGGCAIRLDEDWIDAPSQQIVQILSSPADASWKGQIHMRIAIKRWQAERSDSVLAMVAEDERRRMLCSLERSVEYATRAAREALRAVEKGADHAERSNLRAVAAISRREADRAKGRVRAARALKLDTFCKRAKKRLERFDALTTRTKTHKGGRTTMAKLDATVRPKAYEETKNSIRATSEGGSIKRRELAHVETVVTISPNQELGVIWGEVDEDETSALLANRSGSRVVPPHPHAERVDIKAQSGVSLPLVREQPPRADSASFHDLASNEAPDSVIADKPIELSKDRRDFNLRRFWKSKEAARANGAGMGESIDQSHTKINDSHESLESQIEDLNTGLEALTTRSRARTRSIAAAAGDDLAVLGLRRDAQASRLGVQVGWRAVELNGERLRNRDQLLSALRGFIEESSKSVDNEAGSEEHIVLKFTRRIEWRREREQLRRDRRLLLSMKRQKNEQIQAKTVRKKCLSLDLRKPLGIVWTKANVGAYGYQHGHLEVLVLLI